MGRRQWMRPPRCVSVRQSSGWHLRGRPVPSGVPPVAPSPLAEIYRVLIAAGRRAFVVGLAGAGLLAGCGRWPWQAPAVRVARVGVLSGGSAEASTPEMAMFRQGLRGQGWVEGENLRLESRFGAGNAQTLQDL